MTAEPKYARIEREVRFRLPRLPDLPRGCRVLHIEDRYLRGTGLRLRRVDEAGQATLLKLGQKVRLDPTSPAAVAHTTVYLTPVEHDVLAVLPAHRLGKTRRLVRLGDGVLVAVDVFGGALTGLVTAEVDVGGGRGLPGGPERRGTLAALLDGGVEVTADERYTGGALAAAEAPPPWPTPPDAHDG